MAKYNKIQKKKTLVHTISNIIFKILIAIAIIIFAYIIYDKSDFSSNKIDFSSNKSDKKNNPYMPSQVKWFDDFKGIENVPSKKKQKSSDNTGFRYEGF